MANGKDLVRLYYLGGLAQKGQFPNISAANRMFRLWPVGEYLEVSRFYADELMRKYRRDVGGGNYQSAFTLDAGLARKAKIADDAGTPMTDAEVIAATLSDKDLLRIIEERGLGAKVAKAEAKKQPEAEPEPQNGSEEAPVDPLSETELLTGSKTARKTKE